MLGFNTSTRFAGARRHKLPTRFAGAPAFPLSLAFVRDPGSALALISACFSFRLLKRFVIPDKEETPMMRSASLTVFTENADIFLKFGKQRLFAYDD